MRVLLDECVPRRFRSVLPGVQVSNAREQGWDSLRNGETLTAMRAAGFTTLVTVDRARASLAFRCCRQRRRGAPCNDGAGVPSFTACEMGPGSTVFIPGGTPHHALAIESTDVIDMFTPVREDLR